VLLQGTATAENGRSERVTILGVGPPKLIDIESAPESIAWQPSWRIWELLPAFRPKFRHAVAMSFPYPSGSGARLPVSLATKLALSTQEHVSLRVSKASEIPRESLLGRRGTAEATNLLDVQVQRVFPDDQPAAQFNLAPGLANPNYVYLPRFVLQEGLGL